MLFSLFISCLFCFQPFPDSGQAVASDTLYHSDSGYVKFTSDVPLHSFSGESDYLNGMIDFEKNVVDFYLDLNTLKTGIGRRDRDMYETLNVKDHPFAEFSGQLEPATSPPATGKDSVTATGTFTINGISRELSIRGVLQKQGEEILLQASWGVSLAEYDIEPPGILFYRVDDVQEVEIRVNLQPKSASELNLEN